MAKAKSFLVAWRHALCSEYGPSRSSDRLVALGLSLYLNSEGLGAWPSQDTLVIRTGLSERTVRDALERLCSENWLSRMPRKPPEHIQSADRGRAIRWGYEYRARLPGELAAAYLKGEMVAAFSGQDPRRPPAKKKPAIDDRSNRQPLPTNAAEELIRTTASKKEQVVLPESLPERPGGAR